VCCLWWVWDKDRGDGRQSIRDVKEQEVYFGGDPLMTENGTFIINGTERVWSRSCTARPARSSTTTRARATLRAAALQRRIIPYRGSWIDFEFDHKDILYVRIDRRRSCRRRCCCGAGRGARHGEKTPTEFKGTPGDLNSSTPPRPSPSAEKGSTRSRSSSSCSRPARHPGHQDPKTAR